MCGIAGVFYRDGRVADERVLREMATQIRHRGPDGDGVKGFAGAGLAHRRLSIIDLSAAAAQPMGSEDGSLWITFNGEIYNFQALRAELVAKGHRFRSTGDTEVVLHLYQEMGADCIARLDGMFACAIWDDRAKKLLLARDRTGKKPVYVYDDGKQVVFASEIKSILVHPGVDRAMNEAAIPLYLTYGYVPTPHTCYQRISKLPPASIQTFGGGAAPEPVRFWDFPVEPERKGANENLPAVEERIRTLFTEAVARRLVSDVPLGAFLSGGVDSTLVVGVMSGLMKQPVKTFSIGFEGSPDYDETAYARMAAKHFHTDHTEFKVKPESFDLLEKLAWHYDEPFGDSSAIPTYIVSKMTREHVTVALTGDGGDELFAGYSRFHAAALSEQLPRLLMKTLREATRSIPGGDNFRSVRNRGKRFVEAGAADLAHRFRGWVSFFTPEELQGLLSPGFARYAGTDLISASYSSTLAKADGADLVNRVLYLNASTYLLDDLNVKMDRAAMAASLEARSPFLDTALMDYVFRLPGSLKLHGRKRKWILKRAFRNLVPKEILDRPKMGFGVPLGTWFRGELKGFLHERLLDPAAKIYPMLQRPFVERMMKEHQSRHRDWGVHFWSLAMLELWLEARAKGER